MEEKKYVTLEEMDELFAKEVNKRRQLYGNEPILAKKLHSPVEYMVPLLDQHLYAERLLRRAYKDVDWTKECPFPVSILTYAKLWMNPLMWKEPNIYEDFILDGRMAVEEYDTTRFIEIERIVCNIYEEVILSFADNPIAYNEDMLEVGYTKGMHEWSPLIWDVYSYIYKVLDGESIDWDEMDKKHYDFIRLRFNLNIIAENRGGKRAAELLQMLQKEWSKIKRWKTNMEKVEEKDIAEFEEHLFNGFDDLLEEWEAEEAKNAEQNSTRGPKVTTLFKDRDIAESETDRFLSFINRHKMNGDDVDSSYDNRVNQVAVCFFRIWKEKKCLMSKASGTSLSRFIIENGLSLSVKEKAHGNALNRMINSNDMFVNWIGEVRASF